MEAQKSSADTLYLLKSGTIKINVQLQTEERDRQNTKETGKNAVKKKKIIKKTPTQQKKPHIQPTKETYTTLLKHPTGTKLHMQFYHR